MNLLICVQPVCNRFVRCFKRTLPKRTNRLVKTYIYQWVTAVQRVCNLCATVCATCVQRVCNQKNLSKSHKISADFIRKSINHKNDENKKSPDKIRTFRCN